MQDARAAVGAWDGPLQRFGRDPPGGCANGVYGSLIGVRGWTFTDAFTLGG
jgi:hypothetical protein